MRSTRILDQSALRRVVDVVGLDALLDELIAELADAFRSHDPEVVETMARNGFRYTKPDLGLLEWMPAMVAGSRISIKTVGYHPTNPVERNVPSVLATTALYDASDGRLLTLCDATLLTALRTGAASAVVTEAVGIDGASTLGVIGCGAQAVSQIHAISRVRPIERIHAYDSDGTVSSSLANRLRRFGFSVPVEIVDDAEEVVRTADVLCTATSVDPGAGPVFQDVEHAPWLHVNAIGADLPGKFELPLPLLQRSMVIPDHVEQCLAEGEAQRLGAAGIGPDMTALLRRGDVAHAHRARPTVFDSTGWALEDLVAAEVVLRHAERHDLGFTLDLQPDPTDPYDPYEL